jgi:type I restriction enzyme S subunit
MRKQIIRSANGVTRINLSRVRLARVLVPIRSWSDQKRISVILDQFERLASSPAFGLPAELGARRKQYEYYRDKLLTFKEATA